MSGIEKLKRLMNMNHEDDKETTISYEKSSDKDLVDALKHYTDYKKTRQGVAEQGAFEAMLIPVDEAKGLLEQNEIVASSPVRIIVDYDPEYETSLVRLREKDYVNDPGDGTWH